MPDNQDKVKFTPGPWTADTEGFVFAAKGYRVAQAYDPQYSSELKLTPKVIANARLIAAAPEMYETLKVAAKWFTWSTPLEVSQLIQKAISKAEGK